LPIEARAFSHRDLNALNHHLLGAAQQHCPPGVDQQLHQGVCDTLPQHFFERVDRGRGAHPRDRHLEQRLPGGGNDRGYPPDDGGQQPGRQQ
jgi:hypothetical protein